MNQTSTPANAAAACGSIPASFAACRALITPDSALALPPASKARSGPLIRDKYAGDSWDFHFLSFDDEYGFPGDAARLTFDRVGIDQKFTKGTMCWHPDLGCSFIPAAFEALWITRGREQWGYPTTDRDGGMVFSLGQYQHFRAIHREGQPEGSIYQRSGAEPHSIDGPIRDRWIQGGGERSTLGYPTSEQYSIDDSPHFAQDFEEGRIVLFEDQGAVFDPLVLSSQLTSAWPAGFEGEVSVSIYADLRVRWQGRAKTTNFDNYDFYVSAVVPLPSNPQLMLGFPKRDKVFGTFTSGPREMTWDEWFEDTILEHANLRDLQSAELATEYDYSSTLVGTIKDVVGFALTFIVGTGVSYFSGGIGLALLATGTTVAVVGIAKGSWETGLRLASGVLWMAGPHNTLIALGSEWAVSLGERAEPIPQGVYDWMNQHVFAGTLPEHGELTLTDTQGAQRRPFVFPRYDGQIMLNFPSDEFENLIQLGDLLAPPEQLSVDVASALSRFAHELLHTCQVKKWRAKHYINVGMATLPSQAGGNAYEYEIGKVRFSDYTMEQQGAIVEDWVNGTHSPNGGRQLDSASPLFPYITEMRAGLM